MFCDAKGILNENAKLPDDPNNLKALKPNHLLLLKGKLSLPPRLFGPNDQYAMEAGAIPFRSFLEDLGMGVLALTLRKTKM